MTFISQISKSPSRSIKKILGIINETLDDTMRGEIEDDFSWKYIAEIADSTIDYDLRDCLEELPQDDSIQDILDMIDEAHESYLSGEYLESWEFIAKDMIDTLYEIKNMLYDLDSEELEVC